MRRLILFRHAKSDWSEADADDRERALAPRGRRAAGPMGAWLAGRGFRPDLVLCSPAARARETWKIAKATFTPAPETRFEDGIYEASPEALLEIVKQIAAIVQTAMIVGHNPGLGQFVEMLATKGDPEARRAFSAKYPTGAIAVIDLPFDDWTGVAAGAGRLDRFVTPKALGVGGE